MIVWFAKPPTPICERIPHISEIVHKCLTIYSIHISHTYTVYIILHLYTVHVYSSLFFHTASLWEPNSPFLPILGRSLHVLIPILLKQIIAMTLSALSPLALHFSTRNLFRQPTPYHMCPIFFSLNHYHNLDLFISSSPQDFCIEVLIAYQKHVFILF